MKKNIFSLALLVAAGLVCNSCCAEKQTEVKNVIFMIGDGMGLNQAYAANHLQGGHLYMMDEAEDVILQTTYSASSKITDSAASGTALATGVKTKNGMIGMNPDSVAVESILEQAMRNGKATGEVVTVYLPHATPAAYVAHQVNRGMNEEIAMDFLKTTPDVMMGGGIAYFENRSDSCNLSDSLRARGYDVVYNMEDAKKSTSSKLLGLFADKYMPTMMEGRGNYLPEAVDLAIKKLNTNKNGFFLMVEGSQIDSRCHSNDFEGTIAEVIDFDKAVKVAFDFAREDGHTMVVVTADHETGGLTLLESQPTEDVANFKYKYNTSGHTGVPVPVYVFGPGSENYKGMGDNTMHKAIIAKVMGLK